MPHYDYQCTHCNHQLKEIFQKITDQPLEECPKCHCPALKRGPGGGFGLIFRGSGFYINDYASTSSEQEASQSQASSPASSCCPCGQNTSCS